MKLYQGIFILSFAVILSSCSFGNTAPEATIAQQNIGETFQTKALENDDLIVVMSTTKGDIKIKLFPEQTPATSLNFAVHAQNGYYNGITFHRIMKGFMMQGGDPEGTGMGGESIYGKPFVDEFHPDLRNIPYSVSMAKPNMPDSNGSQFFINELSNDNLNDKHSVFGQVVEGTAIVDTILSTPVKEDGQSPINPPKINNMFVYKFMDGKLIPHTIDVKTKKLEIQKKIEENKKADEARLEELKAIKQQAYNEKKENDKDRVSKNGDQVLVKYKGSFPNGEVFDENYTTGKDLFVTIGAGNVVPGFDKGLLGLKIGEKKEIILSPEEAYGGETIEAPKKAFQSFTAAGFKLEVGEKLPTSMGEIEILSTTDTTITIENTHDFAGKTLHFTLEIDFFNN